MESTSQKHTLIAAGTEVQGTLTGGAAVTIEGQFVGDVKAPALSIAPGASVRGRIEVDELDSHGNITGEVRARRVRLSGRLGDGTALHAATLEVPLPADGASGVGLVLGHCTLDVGTEMPSGG